MLEIGVVEGDTNYQLHAVASTIRLSDGRIVAANAGTAELRMYGADGTFIRSIGRRGGGPGEFRFIARVYPHGTDSLLVFDIAGNRVSVFDTAGTFARSAAADSLSGDSVFRMDVWLYRRFWVDGILAPEARAAARRTLDRLPLPDSTPLFRYVQADRNGRLWIREPLGVDTTAWRWTVVDSAAAPIAVIETPTSFDPHVLTDQYVLGRWRDADDVNFIRMYGLDRTAEPSRAPGWYAAGAPADTTPETGGQAREEALAALRAAVRNLVVVQENYFPDHGRYALTVAHLAPYGWTPGENVEVEIVANSGVGWAAVAAHRNYPLVCGMGIGNRTPPGWSEGFAHCS
jgi:hypothetical protein